MTESIKHFFTENLWASILMFVLITFLLSIYQFNKTKKELDRLQKINPKADFWGNHFGLKWGRIIPFLLLFVFIGFSYFITQLYQQPTDATTDSKITLTDKINTFFETHFENTKANPPFAGIMIFLIGLIILIGVIKNSNWVLEGGNGSWNFAFISNTFGRNTARILVGIISIVIIFFGITISFFY